MNATMNLSRSELNCSGTFAEEADLDISPGGSRLQKRKGTLEKLSEASTLDQEQSDSMQPMHPSVATKRFASQLTKHELNEINEVSQVYYLGSKAQKIEADPSLENNGFDNERGFYKITLGDHIAYRYEIICSLGKGAFGQVIKAFDYKRNEAVALKIIRNSPALKRQSGVEIKVLNLLRGKDSLDERNVVKMKNYFVFRNHVCISFELMSLNLYDYLRTNQFRGMQLTLIRRITVQCLIALSLMKSLNMIHCDLKPENILFKQSGKSSVKIIDFGSSCMVDQTLYTYIQSRFYRAPEIILQLKYTRAIDMWSLGCILVELFTGRPLFPGECETQMLLRMQEVLGVTPRSVVAVSPRKSEFFNEDFSPILVADQKNRLHRPASFSLEAVSKCSDALFLDFCRKCLEWNPEDRIQPDDALKHPWIIGEGLNSTTLLESSGCSKSAKRRLSRSLRA